MRKNSFLEKVGLGVFGLLMAIYGVIQNAFVKEAKLNTKAKLKKYLVCNVITSVMTGGIVAHTIAKSSLLWTGSVYTFCSIQKRLAIIWADIIGWDNWVSGVRYSLFEAIKEDYIAKNKFAMFISDLAGNGVVAKVFQVVILVFCLAAFILLVMAFLKCLDHIGWSIKVMVMEKKEQRIAAEI